MQPTSYFEPNLGIHLPLAPIRENTIKALEFYKFEDNKGDVIPWTHGQLEIIDCIVNRGSPEGLKRIEIVAATQYGKSLAVAAGVIIRATVHPEGWAIVAGTTEKARIIMDYIVMFSLNSDVVRTQLTPGTQLDRLRMKKSLDRLTFRGKGEIRVFSADSRRVSETSKSLMGFGSANVIQDESALVGDTLQATVMRMLGGHKDNFLVKIGNPFNRGHFWKTWKSGNYHRIFIDYQRGLSEGRFSQSFIEEMALEAMFDILYECKFPPADRIDIKGWMVLLTEDEIRRAFVENEPAFGFARLGCDVAGGGRNYSCMVLRSYNVAQKVYKHREPDTMRFAGTVIVTANSLKVKDKDIFIDKVGVGKGAYDRLVEIKEKVVGVGGADEPNDKIRFLNKRAEMYWRAREWILRGGKLRKDTDWLQLADIKYKVADSSGKIKIMSKEEMLREQIDSPDVADSFAMTFASSEPIPALDNRSSTVDNTVVKSESLDPYE